MNIAYKQIAIGSLLKMLAAIGLVTALMVGGVLAALVIAGVPVMEDEASDLTGAHAPWVFLVTAILVLLYTLVFMAGALLLRLLGRGPRLVVREDEDSLARRFD
jgi:hypothetical protein